MPELPSRTVAFLFSDIEGSTAHWERERQALAGALTASFPTCNPATSMPPVEHMPALCEG
jgi:hypothetical protein